MSKAGSDAEQLMKSFLHEFDFIKQLCKPMQNVETQIPIIWKHKNHAEHDFPNSNKSIEILKFQKNKIPYAATILTQN